MLSSYLPSILVPLVGIVFPVISVVSVFIYIEKDYIN
uniref:Photosystem I reaction center subunit VIII n=1 Tax=Palmophyllum crassum TaxID=1615899 RepID=A0A1L7NY06_9VIRI|nr:photosystem I subunit VIII [Palmophyllum crassum]BAW34804.1 photosystem I subunit VIII [Palmophyllum crassum]